MLQFASHRLIEPHSRVKRERRCLQEAYGSGSKATLKWRGRTGAMDAALEE